MCKTIRKGAKVRYIGKDEEFTRVWGEEFEVYHKEGDFARVQSIKKPHFGICATIPTKLLKVI